MVKKILSSTFVMLMSSSLFADMQVINETPHKIKFSAKWQADVSGKSGKPYVIEAGKSQKITGDLWNKKIEYKAEVFKDGEWQDAFENEVNKLGNRKITIFEKNPSQGGEESTITWTDAIF